MTKEQNSSKKLFVKTYGCQMNVYDSSQMQKMMNAVGYENTDTQDDADMIIINTCHIREKASEKLFSELGRIAHNKKLRGNKDMTVVVAGCVSQALGGEIFKRAPVVDVVVGPESYHTLPDMIGLSKRTKQIDLDFKSDNKFDKIHTIIGSHTSTEKSAASQFLTVQEGCDKFCTFCVVPYTRGAEFSRPVKEIYNEAIRLCESGATEIHLLGQNVNAYHGFDEESGEAFNLAKLIKKISDISDVKRIRYTTSHPRDMTDDLIQAHGDIEKLMPFLHLPVQSGSDAILNAMNRKHRRDDYFKIIDKLKSARPDLALSSDFIVGFPGETDQDFEDTMDLIRRVEFAQCFSFKYSERPGTPAADAKNQVDEDIKSARLTALQKLTSEQQVSFNEKFVGKKLSVLFDRGENRKNEDNRTRGKSEYLQTVVVEGSHPQLLDKTADVEVVVAGRDKLIAKLI